MQIAERLTTGFYLWEIRGRGSMFFNHPVQPEPTFIPFSHADNLPLSKPMHKDDGKVPSLPMKALNSVTSLFRKADKNEYIDDSIQHYPLEAIDALPYEGITGFELQLSQDIDIPLERIHQLIIMLGSTQYPLSFEIHGNGEKTILRFVCAAHESNMLQSLVTTYIPELILTPTLDIYSSTLIDNTPTCISQFGLAEEFMRPLTTEFKTGIDSLTGIYAALEQLQVGETGLIQIIFQGAKNTWSKSIVRSVSDFNGKPFFEDDASMLPLAHEKVSYPLYGVCIRIASQSTSINRAMHLLQNIAQGITPSQRHGSNHLVQIHTDAIPFETLYQDILQRQSHFTGMLLNSRELLNFIHLPFIHVQAPKLRYSSSKTKALPPEHVGSQYILGENIHFGQSQSISLTTQERLRHIHLIGSTGSGKSNLMKNLIVQDIQNGQGICVLDPHGDLVEDVLARVPEERIKDVILVDPSDMEYPVGINLLSARTEIEKIVLESDLVSVFRRQSTSWGDQMTSVLSNAINAFLESNQGGSLLDLRTFLVDKQYRNEFLKTVEDETVIQFWQKEFPLLRSNSIASILTRLDTFLRPKVIRHMMMQTKGLDFDAAMNNSKILLVKLSQGLIGEANSHLLGTLFIAKLNQASQSRQQVAVSQRTPFYLYIDEFQNFITDSLTSILSGARKYGLGLVLAHQDMEQVVSKDREVANSVLSNPYTRICFRCGDTDAKKLEQSFSYFTAEDIQNLMVGEAIVRIGQRNHDGNISTALLPPIDENAALHTKGKIAGYTRENYAGKVYNKKDNSKVDSKKDFKLELTEEKSIEKLKTSNIVSEKQKKHSYAEQQEFRDHVVAQTFIKKTAEARGFKATIEEPTQDGGRVDVGLLLNDLRIACEISVTNTVDYEVKNIQKCINEGYHIIYMISANKEHLAEIRNASIKLIPAEHHKQLFFMQKEQVGNALDGLLQTSKKPIEKTYKGYRVKVNINESKTSVRNIDSLRDIILKNLTP